MGIGKGFKSAVSLLYILGAYYVVLSLSTNISNGLGSADTSQIFAILEACRGLSRAIVAYTHSWFIITWRTVSYLT